jgi:CYTH domain-containing protein
MPTETERKFLVDGDEWRNAARCVECRQAFLHISRQCSIRVRIMGDICCITAKGARQGYTRPEFEYPIPREDAETMIDTMSPYSIIEKTRYYVPWQEYTWEVDEFHGDNQGLVIAEVEFADETADIPLPPWIGEEVTFDHSYDNAYLALHPFTTWDS